MAQHILVKSRWQAISLPKLDFEKLKDNLEIAIDSVVEYPGSKKGDFGRWVPTEWVEAKLTQIFEGGGTERK